VAHIEAKPLPRLASAEDGGSSYGRNAGVYQPDANGAPGTAAAPSYRAPAVAAARSASAGQPATSTRHRRLVAPAVVHVVRAGESMPSIARIYHKPIAVIARANNLAVNAKLKPGERITIPDIKEASATPMRNEESTTTKLAMAESSQTARIV